MTLPLPGNVPRKGGGVEGEGHQPLHTKQLLPPRERFLLHTTTRDKVAYFYNEDIYNGIEHQSKTKEDHTSQ